MYKVMLYDIRYEKKMIEQIALENDSFNDEWEELAEVENHLIRLIKIRDKRGMEAVQSIYEKESK